MLCRIVYTQVSPGSIALTSHLGLARHGSVFPWALSEPGTYKQGHAVRPNQNGIDLTKHCEGCVLMVYLDVVGIPTAGYGHVIRLVDGEFHVNDPITQEQADQWLEDDLALAMTAVRRYVPNLTSENQRAALCDFAFNLGPSNLGRLVKDADGVPERIAQEFKQWTRAGTQHPRGLRIRRALERLLFMTPDDTVLPSHWLTSLDHASDAELAGMNIQ